MDNKGPISPPGPGEECFTIIVFIDEFNGWLVVVRMMPRKIEVGQILGAFKCDTTGANQLSCSSTCCHPTKEESSQAYVQGGP